MYAQKALSWHQQQNCKKAMSEYIFFSESQANTKQISKYYHLLVSESYKTWEKPENKGCTTSTLIWYKPRNMFWIYHARQQRGLERFLQASQIPQGFARNLGETLPFINDFFSLPHYLLNNTSARKEEQVLVNIGCPYLMLIGNLAGKTAKKATW